MSGSRDDGRPGIAQIAEAALALAAASLAVHLLPFRRIAMAVSRRTSGRRPSDPRQVERVRRAIDAWTRRLPIAPKCFSRGVAASWMLNRRGLDAQLHYGAATIDGKLKAHVWVRSGENDVVGCEIADKYALLARFPDELAEGARRSASVNIGNDTPEHEE